MTKTGLETLCEEKFSRLKGLKVGIISNQASVNSNFQHLVDLIVESGTCQVQILFGPEHGFRGELQDMETVGDQIDPWTGLKVVSLYGTSENTLVINKDSVKDLDLLVADLPDIGARYYTFAQTIAYAMKVAKEVGTKILLLDRPNPINGVDIEGLGLNKACRSFCGYGPVPQRYGLTLGELLHLYNEFGIGEGDDFIPPIKAELEIVKLQNWNRQSYQDNNGLPWVLPSPNMPTLDTAIIYPGSCLFEATEISEGRGTTKPLEQFGAPYIDGRKWRDETYNQGIVLRGAVLRPTFFVPKFQKHAAKTCGGVQLHITDRHSFKPLRWCLALIVAAKKLYPNEFAWRKQAFEFIDKVPAIDLLYGNSNFRMTLEKGRDLKEIESEISAFETNWLKNVSKYHLY